MENRLPPLPPEFMKSVPQIRTPWIIPSDKIVRQRLTEGAAEHGITDNELIEFISGCIHDLQDRAPSGPMLLIYLIGYVGSHPATSRSLDFYERLDLAFTFVEILVADEPNGTQIMTETTASKLRTKELVDKDGLGKRPNHTDDETSDAAQATDQPQWAGPALSDTSRIGPCYADRFHRYAERF